MSDVICKSIRLYLVLHCIEGAQLPWSIHSSTLSQPARATRCMKLAVVKVACPVYNLLAIILSMNRNIDSAVMLSLTAVTALSALAAVTAVTALSVPRYRLRKT